jgi:hypothetical protein
MKKIVYPVLAAFFYLPVIAQTDANISEDFKQLSGEIGKQQSGFENLQSYNSGTKGSQFFYPGWTEGSVTTNDNKTIDSKDYLYLFDKVRQVLFITSSKTQVNTQGNVLTADPDKLKAFTLITDKPHYFIKACVYDSGLKNDFFEVLIESDNYSLLKLTTSTFQKADEHDMLAMKNGNFSDEFVDNTTYYIYHNSKITKVNLTENSLRKALKEEKIKVDTYFNMHQNDEMSEDLLTGLINYLNT